MILKLSRMQKNPRPGGDLTVCSLAIILTPCNTGFQYSLLCGVVTNNQPPNKMQEVMMLSWLNAVEILDPWLLIQVLAYSVLLGG